MASQVSQRIGAAVTDERQRRGWAVRELAARARVAPSTVTNVEAGRRASLDVYARLAVALGLSLDVVLTSRRRSAPRASSDLVHAAMGEDWALVLRALAFQVSIDHPYQHYQFAGRADVLSWALDPPALLHIENRTRFPDLQQAAGSYNAKRQYLARTLAERLGIRRFSSETHVMAGLWSAEVLHVVRQRRATFQALCPDTPRALQAWLDGQPPTRGHHSTFVLLDPFASGRQARMTDLDAALERARPRVAGYAEAARRLAT